MIALGSIMTAMNDFMTVTPISLTLKKYLSADNSVDRYFHLFSMASNSRMVDTDMGNMDMGNMDMVRIRRRIRTQGIMHYLINYR